ncbi:MAG TPA: glycoside hydrolase family 15 protein [Methanotrichaceae archaeon]|nr:glycoside hydrolase family 15 protein [Methanotrichaceae archaeon]
MPREIVVGNGRLAVAIDRDMCIRDFFYPHVGLENHVIGHKFLTGVWIDGSFSWIGPGWEIGMEYLPETLVSRFWAKHKDMGVLMEVNDAVHSSLDLFLRKATICNRSAKRQRIRVFFTQDFHTYGDNVGDTVMYDSILNSIIHFKRKRYFLVSGNTSQRGSIFQIATGHKEISGLEGTWRDAEDGVLSGNPIAQGSVDSVVSFEIELNPGSRGMVYYWIACGRSLEEAKALDSHAKKTGVEQLLLETENYWSAWSNRKEVDMSVLPQEVVRMLKRSLLIMRAHADSCGGIIASCDSDILQFSRDTYSYIWPRDGAIVAMAFDLAGFQEVSRQFFSFCNRAISEQGFLHHKYAADGSVGSTWLASVDSKGRVQLPIQEDETALVIYALWKHFQKYRDVEFVEGVYQNLVVKATEFLLEYRDPWTGLPRPSFDLWEEKTGVFTWTVSTVYAALKAAERFARVFYDKSRQEALARASAEVKKAMIENLYDSEQHRFLKAVYPDGSRDLSLDASTAAIFMYGPFPAGDNMVEGTMKAITAGLWVTSGVGGMARYEGDNYQRVSQNGPGNPWFICTLWLARWKIARARSLKDLQEGMDIILWTIRRSQPAGAMAEQIDPGTGAPVSVSPLPWSHAEFVIAVHEYLRKHAELMSAANSG